MTKFHQKALELFRQAWCIPETLRGLVWQLVSGAREENAACVILNPSAAVTGSSRLGPSSLLSTEHLLCFPADDVKDCNSAKGGYTHGKVSSIINSISQNIKG